LHGQSFRLVLDFVLRRCHNTVVTVVCQPEFR
jgi:hypothetical protein